MSLVLPDGGDTEWRVLAGDAGHLFFGIGAWTDEGPSQDPDDRGQYMSLELEGGTWVWRASTTLTVGVNEFACTSSRDPTPFPRTPTVVETDSSVTVYWTSSAPTGDQSCPGTVEQQTTLAQPLGDRDLLDASSWPPAVVG